MPVCYKSAVPFSYLISSRIGAPDNFKKFLMLMVNLLGRCIFQFVVKPYCDFTEAAFYLFIFSFLFDATLHKQV